MIPEFKDYILEECFKRKIIVPLEVLSASVHFDVYEVFKKAIIENAMAYDAKDDRMNGTPN